MYFQALCQPETWQNNSKYIYKSLVLQFVYFSFNIFLTSTQCWIKLLSCSFLSLKRIVWSELSPLTYLGSQYSTLNSGLSLVTKVSFSIRSSVMVGGGRAMARATSPSNGGDCLRLNENENWGRWWAMIWTTWKQKKTEVALKRIQSSLKFP